MLETRLGWAGTDEAGRGPLAGPVVAAAVVLPLGFDRKGLNDSKKLSAETRARLEERILADARYRIEFAWPDEIDEKNILRASLAAMSRSVHALGEIVGVLVDGNQVPPGIGVPVETVVKGDGKYAEIAAASILAKQARDRYMIDAAKMYPEYGFDRHFGYPTPEHFEVLNRLGPCPIHRKSFAPVAQFFQATLF